MYDSERDSFMIALKALGYSMNTTNESEIEEAYQWLIDQRDTMDPIYAGDDVIDNMISGNKALAVVYSGDASYIISENPNLCAISGTVNFKQGGFFDIKKNALTFAQIAKLNFNNPQAATRITVGPQADFILSSYFNAETGNHEVKSGTVIDLSKEVNINWRGENRPVQVTWFKKEGKKKTLVEMKEVSPAKYELSGNAGEEYVLQLSCPNFFEGLSCKGAFTKIQSRTFIIK